MPQLDQSGPMGQGPKTGRQQGKCNSAKDSTFTPGFPAKGIRRKMRFQSAEDSEMQPMGGRRKGAGCGRGNRAGQRLRQRQ